MPGPRQDDVHRRQAMSRFVNDRSLRRVGLLACDDVIACPWPQSASVRIRHERARSDPARRHAAFGMVPAREPARGMDHDPRPEFHVFAVLAVSTCELTGYGPGKLWCPTCSPQRAAAAAEGSAQRSGAGCLVLSHHIWLVASRLGHNRGHNIGPVSEVSGLSECVRFSLHVQVTWRVSVILAGRRGGGPFAG